MIACIVVTYLGWLLSNRFNIFKEIKRLSPSFDISMVLLQPPHPKLLNCKNEGCQGAIQYPIKYPRWRLFQKKPPDVFYKKGVLENFVKFTGKYLCQSLLFNKVTGQACTFIKTENLAQVFSCEFCENFKNTFFTEHPGRLLLPLAKIVNSFSQKSSITDVLKVHE